MIAVFSAYREADGEWEQRLKTATELAQQMHADDPFTPIGTHTRDEAELMVAECVRRHETVLFAVTSASHSQRAWLTLVKVLIDQGRDREIHAQVFQSDSPQELGKIARYEAIGHVASRADFLAYNDWWVHKCATS